MSFLVAVVYIILLNASYTYPIREMSRFVNVVVVCACVRVTDASTARGIDGRRRIF